MRGEDQRLPWLLPEVEVPRQVAEDGRPLPYVGPRIRPPVRPRIEPPALQEVVLDELDVRVEAKRLVVDQPAACVGADHQTGNAQPVAVLVDPRRHYVVIEPGPVVPG